MDRSIAIEKCLGKPKSRIIRISNRSSYLEAVRVGDRDFSEFNGNPVYFDAYYGPADEYEVVFFILRSPDADKPELWMYNEVKDAVLAFSKHYKFGEPHLIAVGSLSYLYLAARSYIQPFYKDKQEAGFCFAHNNRKIALTDIWEVGN